MIRQEIEINILPDGRTEYTIRGIKGSTCDSVSALLERLGEVESEERTGEYYDSESDASITLRQA